MSWFECVVIGHWGAYPAAGDATSCYLVRSDQAAILLDCGSGALSALQAYIALGDIDAVFLSHYHADHIADLGSLHYAAYIETELGLRKRPLKVYGPPDAERLPTLSYKDYAVGAEYNGGTRVDAGQFTVEFALGSHTDPSYAMKVSSGGVSMVYSGDTGYSEAVVELARGAGLFICEASLYDDMRGKIPGHSSAGEAGAMAREAGAGALALTHLPHFGDHARLVEEAKAEFDGPVVIASRGLSIEVGAGGRGGQDEARPFRRARPLADSLKG